MSMPKSFMRRVAAEVEDLIQQGMLERNKQGGLFLTKKGYDYVAELRRAGMHPMVNVH